MENKAAGQYLTRVKRALVCGKDDRCRLLAGCAAMIDTFQQENPEAGYDGLAAAFGEPDAFAAELLSGLDESKVIAARTRRRRIRRGVLALVIAALLALSAFLYIKYRQSMEIGRYIYAVRGVPHTTADEEYEAATADIPEESTWRLEE